MPPVQFWREKSPVAVLCSPPGPEYPTGHPGAATVNVIHSCGNNERKVIIVDWPLKIKDFLTYKDL